MKNFLSIFALSLLLMAWGCEGGGDDVVSPDDEKVNGREMIELSESKFEVDCNEVELSISVESTCSWSASCDADWIDIKVKSGIAGTERLTFVVQCNATTQERKATITIKNGTYGVAKELYIIQAQFTPIIELGKESLNVAASEGEQSVTISANIDFEVMCDAEWISISTKSGTPESEKIKFFIEENCAEEEREATLIVKGKEYDLKQELKITQVKFTPAINIQENTLSVAANGGNYSILVEANVDYEASSDVDWISCTKGETGVSLHVEFNHITSERTGNITIASKEYDITYKVVVTQAAGTGSPLNELTSVSYLNPNGNAVVETSSEGAFVTVKFEVLPKATASQLAQGHQHYLKMQALYTDSAEVTYVDMPICEVTADNKNGILTIKASGELLSKEFYSGQQNASMRLVASDAEKELRSEYKKLSVNRWFTETLPTPATNQILYCAPGRITPTNLNAEILSNLYDHIVGCYVITLDGELTSIGDEAFYGCGGLTSITIPDSVTAIGYEAFYGCGGLTSITIPDSVTAIGYDAFYNCVGLTSVTVSEGNTVYDSRNNCNAIVETATNALIQGCKATIIPDSVTSIGYRAFSCCLGLTSITIPDSVTAIGYEAFSNCVELTSVTIGRGVTWIRDRAFFNCLELTSITIPDSVTAIGYEAFLYCTGLTSVTIGRGVTRIGDRAFFNCLELTSITIPDSVTAIGYDAFSNCVGLTSVTIGRGVTWIGDRAFDYCDDVEVIYCKPETPPELDGGYPFDDASYFHKIYVPRASVEAYKAAKGWREDCDHIVGYDF